MGGGQGVGARNQAEEAWRSRISPAIELGREEEMAEVEEEEDGRRNIYLNPYRLLGQPPAYLVAGVLVACRHVARLETSTEVARWGVSAGTSLLFTFLFFSCLNPRLGIHLSLNFILKHWNRH